MDTSWVIRQNSESQNAYFKETKYAKFSEKTNISYPLIRTLTMTHSSLINRAL